MVNSHWLVQTNYNSSLATVLVAVRPFPLNNQTQNNEYEGLAGQTNH